MKNYKITPLVLDLKRARTSRAMTQAQLASYLEIPQSYVSQLENCYKDPRLSTVIEWARLLRLELMLVPKEHVLAVNHILHLNEIESQEIEPAAFQPLPEEL